MTYFPPGVNITESVNSQSSPLVASSSDICLIGPAFGGYHVEKSIMKLATTNPQEIPFFKEQPQSQKASLVKVLKVENKENAALPEGSNGNGYKETRDFTVNTASNSITKTAYGSESEKGKIAENTEVIVTFEYIPADYYNPKRMFSQLEVLNRYGPAWNAEGSQIVSPLSMAAVLAFENGASSVLLQPLFKLSSGSSVTYNTNGIINNATKCEAKDLALASTWNVSLEALQLVPEVEIIVPIAGQHQNTGPFNYEYETGKFREEPTSYYMNNAAMLNIFGAVHAFQQNSNREQKYAIAIFGEDSTGNTSSTEESLLVTAASVRGHAENLEAYQEGALNSQCAMINTTNFILPRSQSSTGLNVGGQYMAAAVGGALAARSVSSSLTRKGIIGFSAVADIRSNAEKQKDAEAGLMVIEQNGNQVRCRHAITMDTTHGASRSELSVVRAKFLMIASVKSTLEDHIIGQIIADSNSPIIVRSAISGVLSQLQANRYIVDYQSPRVSISSIDPTTIQATFSYRPSFTVNYININFSLDLTNQTVSTSEENSNTLPTL